MGRLEHPRWDGTTEVPSRFDVRTYSSSRPETPAFPIV